MKLKAKYKTKVVGFNNSTAPLGERDDLDILAEIALNSGDETLLELFETPHNLKEIVKKKEAKFLKENSPSDKKETVKK